MRYLGSDKGITFPPGGSHYFINWKQVEDIEPTDLNRPTCTVQGSYPLDSLFESALDSLFESG